MNNTKKQTSFQLYFTKALVLLLFMNFAIISAISAQASSNERSNNKVIFKEIKCTKKSDTLVVSFDLQLKGEIISSGEALHIQPVYRDDENEIRLPQILINGKKRARFYRREQTLLSYAERLANQPYMEMVLDSNELQEVSYNYSILLPSYRNKRGALFIEHIIEDCCDMRVVEKKRIPIESNSQIGDASLFANTLTYIRPLAEKEKVRKKAMDIRIQYPRGRHDVQPNFMNNSLELMRMDKIMRPLFLDKETYEINSIAIKGFASPEDSYSRNLRLSKLRTETFKSFLIQKYRLNNMLNFTIQGMGEDWDGLLRAVESSNMDYKREVISIIKSIGVFDGRETLLMNLAGGGPYKFMMREFFPYLRRMEMEISYTVRPFLTNESEKILLERPNELNHREIYDLAKSKGDNDLLKIAPIYFPDDVFANVNASSVELAKGNTDRAWTYLEKVQDNIAASNNLGVYYCLRGDLNKARGYFQIALTVKELEENARANLSVIDKYLN